MNEDDRVALIDLDGTVADYDASLKEDMRRIQAPEESPFTSRYERSENEPPHVETRRKLIQRQPGFWRSLKPISTGFEVVAELRRFGFSLHVLTKGPITTPGAWGEKVEWCQQHIPDAVVTVTGDKSLVYGRVLVDDFPPYFTKWLVVRPRGLVVCVAQPWNVEYKNDANPQVLRYDGTNHGDLCRRLAFAYERAGGQP